MKYLVTRWFGTFLFNKNEMEEKILFPKNVDKIVDRLKKVENGEILTEEKKIAKERKVIVNERRLSGIGEFKPNDNFFKDLEILPSDFGFTNDLLKKASIAVTKEKMDKKLESKDLQIVQMVNTLDDLVQTHNLLSERLDSWSLIPTPEEKMKPLNNSMSSVKNEIKALEQLIEEDMNELAPNISKIIGPHVGARLIAYAGGLQKLAMLPASTVQILGAEKALFRFKKEGGRPPKHGVIFQHPYIRRAHKKSRGRISRAVSAKISIAAKADAFTKRDIASELKQDLEARIKEIKKL